MLKINLLLSMLVVVLTLNAACTEEAVAVSTGTKTISIDGETDYVNVMGDEMIAMPQFSALAKKPGKARGYVKDWTGKPLTGAYIGVRASGLGGKYAGAHTETDAKGYYEINIPWGTADFYAAGYTIDYAAGRAALGLQPADGETGGFASAEGAVENFVLFPYGAISNSDSSENPRLASAYYGGSISLNFGTRT
ncbi:MAG TPA: hypothetical protein VF692_02770, partial [Pyrinomonadaceae bacterium]